MYNSRNIDDLRSDVAANCRVWLELCRAAGLQVLITGTVRDEEYQQQCYRNGTSKSPRPAFHAQGVGLAFDFCRNIKGHEYDDLEFFRRAGELGEKIGFEWGGRWTSFPDRPHLQWSGPNQELTSKDIWAGKRPPAMPLYQKEDVMTQEQFNVMFQEAVKKYQTPPVPDNTPAEWEREGVEWAMRPGLLKGDDIGNLMLHSPITRAQFCVMLKRYNDMMAGGKNHVI